MKHDESVQDTACEYLAPFDARWEAIAGAAELAATTGDRRGLGERFQLETTAIVMGVGRSFTARTRDLSCSGCALSARVPDQLGSHVIILLETRGRSLLLEARRRWSSDRATAFEFVDVNDSDRLSLAEHLDHVWRHRFVEQTPLSLPLPPRPAERQGRPSYVARPERT